MCAGDKMGGEVYCPETVGLPFQGNAKIVQQLYRLRQKHNIKERKPEEKYGKDWLALSTDLARKASALLPEFSGSYISKISSSTTAAHMTVFSTLAILCSLIALKITSEPEAEKSKAWTIAYLTSFAIHFGTQIWMTMVSGLVLYFSLPRHVFGNVQEHLFPAYYTFSSVVGFFIVLSFTQMQPDLTIKSKTFVQLILMLISFALEMCIRLYVAQTVVALKHTKNKMEMAAGSGQEIGRHILGDLANCPHYMKILRRFRRLHSYTAIVTLFTVVCSIYHINYLAEKICI